MRLGERRGDVRAPLVLIPALAIVPLALIIAASSGGSALLWPAAAGFGATAAAWNASGMLAVVSEVGAEEAGRASGIVLFGFYGGFVVSPVLFGYSVDRTGSYAWGWGAPCSPSWPPPSWRPAGSESRGQPRELGPDLDQLAVCGGFLARWLW